MTLLSIMLLFLGISVSNAFLVRDDASRCKFALHEHQHRHRNHNHPRLYLSEDTPPFLGEESVSVAAENSKSIFESLRERKAALDHGIGKRYVCRTQKGFLNVHKEPCDPFNTVNIVNQLEEGDIVTSTGEPRGVGGWIPHDHGGWSISMYSGFTFLEELDE